MKRRHFVGLALFAGFSIILTSCFASEPGETTKKFFQLLQEDKISEAESLFSTRIRANAGQKLTPGLNEMASILQENKGKESFSVESETIKGDTAEVVISGVDPTGQGGKMKFFLVKENGEWKIDNFEELPQ